MDINGYFIAIGDEMDIIGYKWIFLYVEHKQYYRYPGNSQVDFRA